MSKSYYISEDDHGDNDDLVFQDQDQDQDDDIDMATPSPYGHYNGNNYSYNINNNINSNSNNINNINRNSSVNSKASSTANNQSTQNNNINNNNDNNNNMNNNNTDTLEQPVKVRKKPGRKPGPYCPAQRKEQNRAAQRAFRDRKERHVYQLESMIKDLKTQHFLVASKLQQDVRDLKGVIQSFQSENFYLREVVFAFESALSKGNHIAILKDVKVELFKRHHHNKSQQQQQQQRGASAEAMAASTPTRLSSAASTPASSASPNVRSASVSSPFSPPASMSPAASTPPHSPAASAAIASATSLSASSAAFAAASFTAANTQADQAQSHHEDKEPRKRSFSDMEGVAATRSSPSPSASNSSSLLSTSSEGVYSMDGDILYKAPPLFIQELTVDGKLGIPSTPYASLSVPRPAYCPPGTTLPKHTDYTKHPTVFDELQSSLFPPGTLESLHISMATPQEVVSDESVFGQAMDVTPQPDKKWDLEPQESKDGIACLEELESSEGESEEDVNNTKEAWNKVASMLGLNKEGAPRHRLYKEFAILAKAKPQTDPNIDPKVYQLPHDPRIDFIPCPKLRAQMIVHQHRYNVDDVFALLTEQAICHGPPLDKDSWQLPDPFFERFGFLLGIELDRIRNKTWPPPKKRSASSSK